MRTRLSWHLGHLDALRGLAVLSVLLVHTAGLYNYMPAELGRTAGMVAFSGQRGVQLFFVVSAFTLFLSAGRRKERSPKLNFFLRRVFRLAPMFYVGIVLTQMLWRPAPVGTFKMLLAMCFLNGFSPTTIHVGTSGGWSIADEAIFYMVLPLLFRWITTLRRAVAWLGAGTAVCYGISMLGAHLLPRQTDFFLLFGITSEFGVFLMGIAAFFLWQDLLTLPTRDTQRRTWSACLMVSIVVLYFGQLPFTLNNLPGTSLLCAMLVLALSLHPWPLLVNRATMFTGRISYSMYILHFFTLRAVQRWMPRLIATHPSLVHGAKLQAAIAFGMTLALTMPIATLT